MLVEKLRTRMGERTQAEFAAELNISQAQLSRILSGEQSIGIRTARAIALRYPELTFDLGSYLLTPETNQEVA